MEKTILYVEKATDAMRSTFTAIGLAQLFFELPESGSGVDVTMTDMGSAFQLEVNLSREEIIEWTQRRGLPLLLPAIHKPLSATEQKRRDAGEPESEILRRYVPGGFPGSRTVDYGLEKRKAEEARQQRRDKNRQEGDTVTRDPNFPIWAHLCSYFGKGSAMRTGYPLMVHVWHAHQGETNEDLMDLILSCYGDFPNNVDDACAQWRDNIKPHLNYDDFEMFNWGGNQADYSALSVISPTTAQGSYRGFLHIPA